MTIEELQHEYEALLPLADIPGNWTPRQRDAYETARSALDGRVRTARTAIATLAEVGRKIDGDEQWLRDLRTWRPLLGTELMADELQKSRTHLARGIVRNLELSIQAIDRGQGVLADSGWELATTRLGALMRESGYVPAPPAANTNQANGPMPWFGSIPVVEARLKELRARRDDAQYRLKAALRDSVEGTVVALSGVGSAASTGSVTPATVSV